MVTFGHMLAKPPTTPKVPWYFQKSGRNINTHPPKIVYGLLVGMAINQKQSWLSKNHNANKYVVFPYNFECISFLLCGISLFISDIYNLGRTYFNISCLLGSYTVGLRGSPGGDLGVFLGWDEWAIRDHGVCLDGGNGVFSFNISVAFCC